jgi:hypothetical protein
VFSEEFTFLSFFFFCYAGREVTWVKCLSQTVEAICFFTGVLFFFDFPTGLLPMANHPFPAAIVLKVEEPEG